MTKEEIIKLKINDVLLIKHLKEPEIATYIVDEIKNNSADDLFIVFLKRRRGSSNFFRRTFMITLQYEGTGYVNYDTPQETLNRFILVPYIKNPLYRKLNE